MPVRWRAVLPLYPDKETAQAGRFQVSFYLKRLKHMEETYLFQEEIYPTQ